jgi:MscS family membrane protein
MLEPWVLNDFAATLARRRFGVSKQPSKGWGLKRPATHWSLFTIRNAGGLKKTDVDTVAYMGDDPSEGTIRLFTEGKMMHPWMRLLVTLALLGVVASIGTASLEAQAGQLQNKKQAGDDATAEKQDDPSKEPTVDAEIRTALSSPYATIKTFLVATNEDRLEDAAQCLDLSKLTATAEALKTKEQELAYKLKEILDKLVRIEVEGYPSAAEADEAYALSDIQSFDEADQGIAEQIVIAQSKDGLWRFTPNTVLAIEKLHEELLDREKVKTLTVSDKGEDATNIPFAIWLAEQFPVGMRKTHFLLPVYQWISLSAIILLGLLADKLTRMLLGMLMKVWFLVIRRTKAPVIPNMWRPVGLFMQGVTWYLTTKFIGLPPELLSILLIGLRYFAVIAGVWTSFHLIDLMARIAARRASKTVSRFDDVLVPLIATTLKLAATCIGIVTCIAVIGATMLSTIFTGLLGIGGMALAFASKDAVSNLFGTLTVLLDRPFEVGDWIVVEGVEGTVESVGFRSTRVRTFYNSIISMPNSRLTTSAVDNLGKRKYRRFKTILGIQYATTPEQIDAFCEGIRELLRRHPYTRKDYYHVYLNDLNDSSIDVLLYCFFECPDWSVELRERHRLLVDILKLAERLGVQFAFPTRTIHMFQGTPAAANTDVDGSDPDGVGIREAMQISGPVVTGDDRRGGVEFLGPS